MAGAKTARAEIRLVSNIFVCVCVCEVGSGDCTSGQLRQVWNKQILFLFLLVFPPTLILFYKS